ncbi:MAG: sigma-54 dependent transcriptional regulator [Deltaproteobacteria bacterium]|nr:sigma-54 dependent transcriptional regulator [Deltaproteobacteria bacterium]
MIKKYLKEIRNLPRFHISLYVIIPFIIMGFTVLAALVALNLTQYPFGSKAGTTAGPVFWATALIAAAAFASGVLIVRLILKPVERFVESARQLTPMEPSDPTNSSKDSGDQIQQFSYVFDQVTSVLSRLESRNFFPKIIGESLPMRGLMSLIMKVSPTDSTVLILGESGTGKELVATSIYDQGLRKNKPFIKLNCAAIPEELLESELFGHEKGAFTGATAFKPGKFDMAEGGTIFLDEIGDMPLNLQSKILRIIQEREFYRVGGSKTIKADVRFIASTNKNLAAMVKEGRFREDLYYRLNVFTLHMPPLRERRDDIPTLVDHFLEKSARKVAISSVALQLLMAYSWPGNVRELQNVIERAAVICENGYIEPPHLPVHVTGAYEKNESASILSLPPGMTLDDRLGEIERNTIIEALRKTGGVQVRATELLGINQRSLWHRIKKHNIDVKNIKIGK